MISYLVSSPGGQYKVDGKRLPSNLNTDNGFVDNLKLHWKENSRGLIICASPDITEINDSIKKIFELSFPMSGLFITEFDVCDNRNTEIVQKISDYDVVILTGGHVPTQNDFFERIHLKKMLKQFDGILIGISSGSMNSAEVVYAQPELEGESMDLKYQRFLTGLGITNLLLLSIFFIVTLNLIILIYNRNETIEFTENYITQKETKNGNYYIYVNNESRLKCPKKIYISILPKRNYVLTYRSNKLRPFNKKIVSATEIE